MFLLLLMFLINHIDKIVGKGLALSIILELIFTNIASMVVMAAPMSVLVATLMAFGGFATDREYTAARAAGISPLRIIMPIATTGFMIAVATAWFSNEILPDLNYRAGNLFLDIRRAKPGFELKENTFYDDIRGYTFLARRFGAEQDTLYNITLFQQPGNNKKEAVIDANYALLQTEPDGQTLTMNMYNGIMRRFFLTRPDNIMTVERTKFDQHRISFDISELSFSKGVTSRDRTERSTRAQEMIQITDSLEQRINSSTQSFFDINRRGLGHQVLADSVEQNLSYAKYTGTKIPLAHQQDSVFLARDFSPLNQDSLLLNTDLVYGNPLASSILSAASNGAKALVNTLYDMQSNLNYKQRKRASYMVEIHKKLSIPLACFIFVFIGAGVGLLTKHGNIGFAAVVSTFILTYYWIATLQGEKLADRLLIEPWLGSWFADITMAIAAIALMLALDQPWQRIRMHRNAKKEIAA